MAIKKGKGSIGLGVGAGVLAGVGAAAPPPPMDLSFLNDPNNPYNQTAPAPSYDPGGGGGYDPGGYAPPPPSLSADPGWIALQAELDQELGLNQAETQRRTGQITGQRERLLAQLIPQGEQERTTISGGMEARGLFGGGQMEDHLARQRANEGQRQTGINVDSYTALSDLQAQQALQAQQIEARRAQARADYMSRGYTA
jgi:hypothetical protein